MEIRIQDGSGRPKRLFPYSKEKLGAGWKFSFGGLLEVELRNVFH
jgi:hypothetical protein